MDFNYRDVRSGHETTADDTDAVKHLKLRVDVGGLGFLA